MKKKTLLILALLTCGLLAWRFEIQKGESRDNNDKSSLVADEQVASSTENDGIPLNSNSPVVATSVEHNTVGTREDPLLKMKPGLSKLYAGWDAGAQKGDIPQAGMADPDQILKAAQTMLGTSDVLDIGSSEIFLVDEVYIVCVPRYGNPFFFYPDGVWNFGKWLGFDAWTGNYVGTQIPTDGGPLAFSIGNKTGGNGSEESIQACRDRFSECLGKLHNAIHYGRATESDRQAGMIDPAQAVEIAKEQVEDRNYDRDHEPWPLLVNDVYVVTFWKKPGDIPASGGKLYDARVGIDAKSGAFIAMDVARTRYNQTNTE